LLAIAGARVASDDSSDDVALIAAYALRRRDQRSADARSP
jgi:hypothetical protein